MPDSIRVMIIGASFKMHLHESLVRYLRNGLEVELVSAELCYGGRVPSPRYRFKKRSGIYFVPTKRMLDKLIHFRPDVIFTDYPAYPSWYGRFYSILRLQHIPVLAWLLGDFWTEQAAFFSNAPLSTKVIAPFNLFTWSTGLGFADRILTVCRWLEGIVATRFPRKSTGVLYQGVDPEPWLLHDTARYPFKHPAVGILQDNNILPKVRGLLWFSNVVKQMRDVHFYIAGGGAYTQLVENAYSGLTNAHFVGRMSYPDGVRSFYNSTDMYVLPSGLDCCPTTLLEASLCARPVLASRIGGIPELVIEGETGWTLPNVQSDAWASRIRSVLEDPELRNRVGGNARSFAIKNFGWGTCAARLISTIADLAVK